jgi:putative addiction module component (TIGR02574 family)
MASSDVLTVILQLPAGERARLAAELIRSLDEGTDTDAAEAWETEIERRVDDLTAGTAETLTLDEYRSHVRARRASRNSQ